MPQLSHTLIICLGCLHVWFSRNLAVLSVNYLIIITITASLSCLPSQAPPPACTANSFAFFFSRPIGRLGTTSPSWIRQRNQTRINSSSAARHSFLSSLKRKVGLIAAKAAALRINMNTDSCLVASRTASRRLASSHATSLLHSSLSHHLPRPQPFPHLT